MKKYLIGALLAVGIAQCEGTGFIQSPADSSAVLKKMFSGKQFKGWKFLNVPVGGSPICTVRSKKGDFLLLQPLDLYKDVTETEKQQKLGNLMKKEILGPLSFDNILLEKNRKASLQIPGLFSLLGIKGSNEIKNKATINIKIEQVIYAELDYGRFAEEYNSGKFNPRVYQTLNDDAKMCFGHLIMRGWTCEVDFANASGSGVELSLKAKVGKVLDSGLGFSYSVGSSESGKYSLSSSEPVIFAYWFRELPRSGRQGRGGILLMNPPSLGIGVAPSVSISKRFESQFRKALLRKHKS